MSLTGKIVYHAWHRPAGSLRDLIAAGGPLEVHRTEQGRCQMEAAAATLTPPAGSGTPLELHLLTGRRYWYQTAFCLWTLANHTGRPLRPVIYDDGTLVENFRESLARLFPSARFVGQPEANDRLSRFLPASRFHFLRDRWTHYPNIRKLIDPHLDSTGWKLVLDSDLLFFRRPDFLVDWLDAPARSLHAVDCETSYGYERGLMNRLAGAPVADLVNVGLTGLHSESIDWERVEYFCRELIRASGTHYYLEQALVAMLVAGTDCAVAPAADYVTCPHPHEAEACAAVMHHYVANSKKWYYRHNWKRSLFV